MGCSPPGSSVLGPWDFLGKNTGVGSCFFFQGILPTQRSNRGLLHCRQILYPLSHLGSSSTHGPHSNPGSLPLHLYERTVSPHEVLRFPRLLDAEPASVGCSRNVEAGPSRACSAQTYISSEKLLLRLPQSQGPLCMALSMNLFFLKKSHAKKPLLYKKERHHSWVSLTLATQKLEFSSDSDTNFLNAP
ncbi:unnamed protein product [Rangifer tarandus platyrhynchus]|uniref:Uncharacterized protein n=2 Tax=Rangifer tarandus platyrhynchus TaxID=3082113 RepID=A0ABN8XSI9_RANTA|nr:unnamed protein product [Rangifer tarandus platyrhynchus]